MSKPPQDWKDWAFHFRKMVPGNVEVKRHHDESDTNHLDILTSVNRDLVYQQGAQALEEHWTTTNCDVLNWDRKGKT